jgi:predicted secreted protein
MDWNAFGLVGHLLLAIVFIIIVFIVAFAVASLILKIVYKDHSSPEGVESSPRKQAIRFAIAVGSVLAFGLLLGYILRNC